MSTPTASLNLTYDQWIRFFTSNHTESNRSVFKEAFNALQQSTKCKFLDTFQLPYVYDSKNPHKGPRFLPLAFPEHVTNSAGVTEDRIATDIDKELWLRLGKCFNGKTLGRGLEPDVSGQRLDLIPTLMGAYHQSNRNDLQINICAYSGHGISNQRAKELNYNAPEVAKEILKRQQANYIAPVNQIGYCSRFTRDGELDKFRFNVGDMILRLHNVPNVEVVVGIRDISSYWLEAMHDLPNKFLVIILDSCYSGGAAEVLPSILNSAVHYYNKTALEVSSSSAIVVQFACRSDEYSYSGYFTPTFMRLQHRATLHAMGTLYEAAKQQPSLMREGFLPSAEKDPPVQHVSFSVFNLNVNPLTDKNCSPHPTLYFEHREWPIVLIKDPFFFEFCYRVFEYDADVLDADDDAIVRGDLGFTSDQFAQLEQLLTAPGIPGVTIFNYWLKMWWNKKIKQHTKMAIVPFKFSMLDGTIVRVSAHYHLDVNGQVECVNYYECKQDKVAPPVGNPWFDKRGKKNVHRYREQIMANNGKLPDCHDALYQKIINYISQAVWNQPVWNMSRAKDSKTYCFHGLSTTQRRGQFEETALDELIQAAKENNNGSVAASTAASNVT